MNIYTDSMGNTSNLKEKEELDKLPDSITTTQRAANFGANGYMEWRKYMERHLKVPDRFENVMPEGNYEVVASFLITKEGKVATCNAEWKQSDLSPKGKFYFLA